MLRHAGVDITLPNNIKELVQVREYHFSSAQNSMSSLCLVVSLLADMACLSACYLQECCIVLQCNDANFSFNGFLSEIICSHSNSAGKVLMLYYKPTLFFLNNHCSAILRNNTSVFKVVSELLSNSVYRVCDLSPHRAKGLTISQERESDFHFMDVFLAYYCYRYYVDTANNVFYILSTKLLGSYRHYSKGFFLSSLSSGYDNALKAAPLNFASADALSLSTGQAASAISGALSFSVRNNAHILCSFISSLGCQHIFLGKVHNTRLTGVAMSKYENVWCFHNHHAHLLFSSSSTPFISIKSDHCSLTTPAKVREEALRNYTLHLLNGSASFSAQAYSQHSASMQLKVRGSAVLLNKSGVDIRAKAFVFQVGSSVASGFSTVGERFYNMAQVLTGSDGVCFNGKGVARSSDLIKRHNGLDFIRHLLSAFYVDGRLIANAAEAALVAVEKHAGSTASALVNESNTKINYCEIIVHCQLGVRNELGESIAVLATQSFKEKSSLRDNVFIFSRLTHAEMDQCVFVSIEGM